ncbi:MAG: phosphoribosylglycinamide synthetase C domain-containing protein, partial [Planctomycetota bacterium]
IEASLDGKLDDVELSWKPQTAVCVTVANEGYPGSYPKGRVIEGLDDLPEGVTVFHAGTGSDADGNLTATGGRVLSVCALADDLDGARALAYEACDGISLQGAHFRRDIGKRHG